MILKIRGDVMKLNKQFRGYDYAEVEEYILSIEDSKRQSIKEYSELYMSQKNNNTAILEKTFKAYEELEVYHIREKEIVNRLLEQAELLETTYKQGKDLIE